MIVLVKNDLWHRNAREKNCFELVIAREYRHEI
jgi:hypothetical protein